jgi:hypothetical protein
MFISGSRAEDLFVHDREKTRQTRDIRDREIKKGNPNACHPPPLPFVRERKKLRERKKSGRRTLVSSFLCAIAREH